VLPGLISGRALVKKKKIANYSMWYGVLLWCWVGGQEGGIMVLCAWCNLQSYAPDDGQIFVRNMLSWSWRSINTVICCI
jgi:hypothetical protein